VTQAAAGDHAAFTALFYQTYRYAFSQVATLLTADEDIRDVLQEVYTRVYTGLPRLREPAAFLSWLGTIARNCALTQRAKNQSDPLSTALYVDGEEDVFLAAETPREPVLDIRAVLEALPREQAQLLVLVYYDGLKLSEIARLQNLPASTVRSRFAVAKRALQKALKGRGIDRTVYGRGGFFSAVGTSLRDAIGTDVLSAATAQDVLDAVLKDAKTTPIGYVAAKLSRRRRNAAVLRIAALVVALSLAASAVMAAVMTQREPPATSPVIVGTVPTTTTGEMRETTSPTTTTDERIATTTSSLEGAVGPTASVTVFPVSTVTETAETTASTTSATASAVTTGTTTTAQTAGTTTKPTTSANPTTTTTTRPISTVPLDFVPDYREGMANTVGNDPSNLWWGSGTVACQDQWLYICSQGEEPILFKQHLITGQRVILYYFSDPRQGRMLNVVGNWIYVVDKGYGIVRLRTDGSRAERLSTKKPLWMAVRGSELFYSDNGQIYRMDVTTRRTDLTSMEDVPLVCADAAYWHSFEQGKVYKWNGISLEAASSAHKLMAVSEQAVYYQKGNGEVLELDRQKQIRTVYRPTDDLSSYLNFIECWEMDGYLVGIADSGDLKVVDLSTGQRYNVGRMPNGFSGTHILGNTFYWWQGETLYARQWQGITFGNSEIVYTSEK
jgi:RNA polymerase sigma-70 factor (ECF subfamily)